MKRTFLILAVAFVAIALAVAGCTQPQTPPATPAPTPVATPAVVETTQEVTAVATAAPVVAKTTSSLVPQPTDVMPDNQAVSVSIEKAGTYSTTIITAFNGGKGLMSVLRLDVKVTKPDGTVITKSIEKPHMGDTIEIEGTKGNDRAEVTVIMNSGTPYKIVDQLVPYKTRS